MMHAVLGLVISNLKLLVLTIFCGQLKLGCICWVGKKGYIDS